MAVKHPLTPSIVFGHWSTIVKALDTQGCELGSSGSHGAIQNNFCCHETGAFGGGDSMEFHPVANNVESQTCRYSFIGHR